MPFGPTYSTIRTLGTYTISSFFSKIAVTGEENVPKPGQGPIICVANHWSGAVDPALLSVKFAHGHKIHYWSKSTLFKNPLVRWILLDSGNIPVDRKTKDNQKLFAATFDALKLGEVVAIFPEGTSYTMPGITSFKDGASWAALEYAKNIRAADGKAKILSTGEVLSDDILLRDVTMCIAGISYTEKDKYRSSAVLQFGLSIPTAPYLPEFLVDPKSAVKKLTSAIQAGLMKVTVNALDFDTLHAATMARKILWVGDRGLPLNHLRDIGQTLVDLFALPNPSPRLALLKSFLLSYRSALLTTHLTHYTLSSVPLPTSLDPSIPTRLPTRFRALRTLLWSTIVCALRLPFFIVPMIVHAPIYAVGRWAGRGRLEEDRAQNKIALGLILAILTYPTLFFSAWLLLFLTPAGAMMAFGLVWLFVVYHNKIVDHNYNGFKKLLASYRVLVGIWAPVAAEFLPLDLDLTSLSTSDDRFASSSTTSSSPASVSTDALGEGAPLLERRPIENNIRRVLRLRIETTSALALFIEDDTIEYGAGEAELVAKLVGWGGKVVRSKSKGKAKATSLKAGRSRVKRPEIDRLVSGAITSAGETEASGEE